MQFTIYDMHFTNMRQMAQPMTYPDHVTVIHKLSLNPNRASDSVLLEAVIYSERHRRVAARCFEDIVVYDYKAGKRTALEPYMVDELQRTYKLQEENQARTEELVSQMESAVQRCEERAGGSP